MSHPNVARHTTHTPSHPNVAHQRTAHAVHPATPPECGTSLRHQRHTLPPDVVTKLHECSTRTPPECGSLGSPERGPTRTWTTTRWPSDFMSLQVPLVSIPDQEDTMPPRNEVTTHRPQPQHRWHTACMVTRHPCTAQTRMSVSTDPRLSQRPTWATFTGGTRTHPPNASATWQQEPKGGRNGTPETHNARGAEGPPSQSNI